MTERFAQALVQLSRNPPRVFPSDADAPQHVRVLLRHPGFPNTAAFPGPHRIVRTIPVTSGNAYGDLEYVVGQFRQAMLKAIREAAHAYLLRPGQAETFTGSFADLKAGIEVVEVGFVGTPYRFVASASDLDGKGRTGMEVYAATDAEAEFQVRWAMCRDQGHRAGDVDRFLERMDFVLVEDLSAQPPDLLVYRDLLVALAGEALANGASGEALEMALQRLRDDGFSLDQITGPRGP